jgi:pimeloyl-ACP methyl ester carboxylesterase
MFLQLLAGRHLFCNDLQETDMSDHSLRPNKTTPRLFAFFLGCALAGGAAAVMTSAARADGPDAEAVTIDTTFIVKTPPVRLDKPAHDARASVILMTGGNGLLNLDMDGNIIDSTGNFLIRSANLFLRHGLNVMMADTAPVHSSINLSDRLSATHAAELQHFIDAAMNRWGKPVWVVGTSNGSVSAVTAAGFLPALSGLRGVVLTSTVTDLSANPANQMTFNTYVSRITVPTLVVWHQNDHCTFSPPSGSAALFTAISSSTKDSESFQGGHSVATDPCGAFSEHGYAGIEEDVVKEIADVIKDTR